MSFDGVAGEYVDEAIMTTGAAGIDYTADGVTYCVDVGALTDPWANGPAAVEFMTVTPTGDGVTETVEIRSENPITLGSEYLRLARL